MQYPIERAAAPGGARRAVRQVQNKWHRNNTAGHAGARASRPAGNGAADA
ncbi:hypothetical protein BPA30113_04343 [Burkholderia paludis]|uniref:Uncharacterized protein n=1 Tax=Burkholderia paludis TaxID=1506587 RepID=A0A6J5EX85_9BURK|nr:hypothetical protein LMG30113_06118 [Burkholderia paludis]VWB93218.1 hypothetical protein BPA30113_04343 [Burkholderia paludis]